MTTLIEGPLAEFVRKRAAELVGVHAGLRAAVDRPSCDQRVRLCFHLTSLEVFVADAGGRFLSMARKPLPDMSAWPSL